MLVAMLRSNMFPNVVFQIIQEKSLCNKEMEDFMKNISTLERNLISEVYFSVFFL